ncbi:MAG TPA: hypothetical protein VND93_13440, partial [Myxococcales bacterium]|nr:hypothetical protein [Myxococcales bacterium]
MARIVHPDGAESLYVAVQQGSAGRGLCFFRSDDRGASWRSDAGIQTDATHRDEADLVVSGRDVALVYSYEGPSLSGSTRHDVYFQWWRYDATSRSLRPSTAIRVFDSTSSGEAYYRAELARDSLGRIWIQAFHLRSDGRHTADLKVSTDGGITFASMTPLVTVYRRAGGRLISLDGSLVFVWDQHQDLGPAWFRTRRDGDPLGSWTAATQAFSDGIYHGAGLSAVKAGPGQFHLVYHAESDDKLWYRFFNGSSFGPRYLVEGTPDWALQPATSLYGGALVIFYNHVRATNRAYDVYA